jgi:triosephosphate isomerase
VDHVSGVVLAYEPIWAIGTGRAATAEGANATIALIRRTVAELAGQQLADGLQIQYGGSVTAANARGFLELPDIDGALVGGASLKAAEFSGIVESYPRPD